MYPENPLSVKGCYRPYDDDLVILRIAPNDARVAVEWTDFRPEEGAQYSLVFKSVLDKDDRCEYPLCGTGGNDEYTGFKNGEDYGVYIVKTMQSGERKYSLTRLFRPGAVPGTVVFYIHPYDRAYVSSGCYPTDPSIIRLHSGRLLIVHGIYDRNSEYHLSKLFASDDDGASWSFLTDLSPCKWGRLFLHRGELYNIATGGGKYPDLLIARGSADGASWSRPGIIIKGDPERGAGVHKEAVPIVSHNGRLWTAFEWHKSEGGNGYENGVVSAPEDADLLDPVSWTASPLLPFDESWPGTLPRGEDTRKLIEGNVVITPEGGLVNILRYNGGLPRSDLAYMLKIDHENPDAPLSLERPVVFPGSHTKFTINYDEKRKRYLSLVNRATIKGHENQQRNILSLISSENLVDWRVEKDIFNLEESNWPEDRTKAAFQYVDWILEGDKILAVSRTALNGARSMHDNNYITFHVIEV